METVYNEQEKSNQLEKSDNGAEEGDEVEGALDSVIASVTVYFEAGKTYQLIEKVIRTIFPVDQISRAPKVWEL